MLFVHCKQNVSISHNITPTILPKLKRNWRKEHFGGLNKGHNKFGLAALLYQ